MTIILNLAKEIKRSLVVAWRSSRYIFVAEILLECYQMVSPIIIASFFKASINEIVELLNSNSKDLLPFIRTIAIVLILQLLSVAISMIIEDLREQHSSKMEYYINYALLKHINELDISYFDNTRYYNMIDKAKRDSVAISKLVSISISILRGAVQIIMCGIILGNLFWGIPFILTVFLIPFAIAQVKFLKLKIEYRDDKIENDRHLQQTSFVLRDKKYAKELRIYHVQNYFLDRYYTYWKEGFDKRENLTRKKIKTFSLTKIIPHFLTIGILIYVVSQIIVGRATVGDFSYYKGITTQFIMGCSALITSFVQSLESLEQMKNYNEFLLTKPFLEYKGKKHIAQITDIEFENVSFKYPGTSKDVLKNVSIKLSGDKIYSLVGRNGAGKSTFVKLLLRLYDPTEGRILVNNIDIRDIDIDNYHKKLGVMFQDFNTYLLPLRENVAMSDLSYVNDDARIQKACESAELKCDSARYVKGLDTYIGKLFDSSGVLLSGGESQRIAIARTFFKSEADFFVMDEPNSALDPEAESRVFEKLAQIGKGRGGLFITHRMATVSIADEILVLDKGVLAESGTHMDLMAANGLYSHLFNMQAEKYKSADSFASLN